MTTADSEIDLDALSTDDHGYTVTTRTKTTRYCSIVTASRSRRGVNATRTTSG